MKHFYVKLAALVFVVGCQTKQVATPEQQPISTEPVTFESEALPASNLEIISKKLFVIMYDTKYRLARSVIYTLTDEQLKKSRPGTRKNLFHQDAVLRAKKLPLVKDADYSNTGYQRGHLANSADFSMSPEANRETFSFANMAPMTASLNEDAWGSLEAQVRLWACGEKKITIVTGPVLRPSLPTLPRGLAIPQEFYKIVLDETPPKKMLSFVYFQTDNQATRMEDRLVASAVLKKKISSQIDKNNFTIYPTEPIGSWKSENCIPKSEKQLARKKKRK